MQYFFQLGHEPEISAAELAAVFSQPLKIINNQYALLETTAELNATKLINQLGGTIKIGRGLQTSDYGLQQTIIKYLNNVFPNGKIEFSLNDANLAIETKKELKAVLR